MSVDSGTDFGWARWENETLLACGVVKAPSHTRNLEDWMRAFMATRIQITTIAHPIGDCRLAARRLVIEAPQFFDSAGGHTSARRGDLLKLTLACGIFVGACGLPTVPVTPLEWKGQLPKRVVNNRIIEILGRTKLARLGAASHAMDAIGLGLWYAGKLE